MRFPHPHRGYRLRRGDLRPLIFHSLSAGWGFVVEIALIDRPGRASLTCAWITRTVNRLSHVLRCPVPGARRVTCLPGIFFVSLPNLELL
jgi:hypothetical protein